MNWINEFDFSPGTYRHYKGGVYVAVDLITHMDGAQGTMEPLPDPLVVYRDLEAIVKHVNGRPIAVHQRYARKLSEFIGMVSKGLETVKRFEKI